MLDSITWLKFREWILYSQIEPFDEWRDDVRTAQIVSTIANLFRGNKGPLPLTDFLLPFGKPKKARQTWQEQKHIALMIAYSKE